MLEETMWKYNEKYCFEFMKDFDICPSLLSKSVAFQVFQHTKDAPEAIYQTTGYDILALYAQKIAFSGDPNQPGASTDNAKKIGRYFTFFKFLDLIMKCAKMTFSGYSTGSESQIYSNY